MPRSHDLELGYHGPVGGCANVEGGEACEELTVMTCRDTPDHESHDRFPLFPGLSPARGEGSFVSRLRDFHIKPRDGGRAASADINVLLTEAESLMYEEKKWWQESHSATSTANALTRPYPGADRHSQLALISHGEDDFQQER